MLVYWHRAARATQGGNMLRTLKDLEGYRLHAVDGDLGSVVDFLFDDERWTIRYLVADTGGHVTDRRVLISPISFRQADWSTRRFHLALTKAQVERSPDIDTDKPVSRQHEREFFRYYGYSYYWDTAGLWGLGGCAGLLAPSPAAGNPLPEDRAVTRERPPHCGADVHLRSASEVRRYHVQGRHDGLGHIKDFIADDAGWVIRYLAMETGHWWFGKKVLVAPEWARAINWSEMKVYVDLTLQTVKRAPEWKPSAPIDRGYEQRLYDHYGRSPYWERERRSGGAAAGRGPGASAIS
jgi:hypothetical protein